MQVILIAQHFTHIYNKMKVCFVQRTFPYGRCTGHPFDRRELFSTLSAAVGICSLNISLRSQEKGMSTTTTVGKSSLYKTNFHFIVNMSKMLCD